MQTTKKTREYRPEAINWAITVHADYLEDKVTLDPNGTPLLEKEAWFKNAIEFKYAIFGREKCPETGKPHLQGFVSCNQQKLLTTMKKLFPRAHLEITKGTPKHNKDYCSKVCDLMSNC